MNSQVKIIFLADTHLGFDYPLRGKSKRRKRGEDFFNNFKAVLKYAENEKADLVIHGGDFFYRSKLPKKIIDISYNILFDFADKGIPTLLVPGNHERSNLPTSLFLGHPNIFVFDKPRTYEFKFHKLTFAFGGFPCDRNEVRKNFTSLVNQTELMKCNSPIKILCVHQAVEGVKVGPQNYTFKNTPDVIKQEDIPDEIDLLLSGHIHRPQILKKISSSGKQIPIFYPGSIERTSFAEMDDPQGFYELIFENGKFTESNFIVLPTRPMHLVEIPNNISKEYLRLYLSETVSGLEKDSIVRLKFPKEINKEILSLINVEFLDSIFPPSMNYEYSRSIFNND